MKNLIDLVAAGLHRQDGRIVLPPELVGRPKCVLLRAVLSLEPEGQVEADQRRADFIRAGGDVLCDQCAEKYYDHPADLVSPELTVLCDRSRVKL